MNYSHLNRLDRKLVDEMAEYWVSEGGDADGMRFCLDAILQRIEEIRKEIENESA